MMSNRLKRKSKSKQIIHKLSKNKSKSNHKIVKKVVNRPIKTKKVIVKTIINLNFKILWLQF